MFSWTVRKKRARKQEGAYKRTNHRQRKQARVGRGTHRGTKVGEGEDRLPCPADRNVKKTKKSVDKDDNKDQLERLAHYVGCFSGQPVRNLSAKACVHGECRVHRFRHAVTREKSAEKEDCPSWTEFQSPEFGKDTTTCVSAHGCLLVLREDTETAATGHRKSIFLSFQVTAPSM